MIPSEARRKVSVLREIKHIQFGFSVLILILQWFQRKNAMVLGVVFCQLWSKKRGPAVRFFFVPQLREVPGKIFKSHLLRGGGTREKFSKVPYFVGAVPRKNFPNPPGLLSFGGRVLFFRKNALTFFLDRLFGRVFFLNKRSVWFPVDWACFWVNYDLHKKSVTL